MPGITWVPLDLTGYSNIGNWRYWRITRVNGEIHLRSVELERSRRQNPAGKTEFLIIAFSL
jgi:hypothetical protein